LPVLFVMTSNHYALTYGHEYNWAILIGISIIGALIRVYFVARHKGQASLLPVIAAALLLAGIVAALAPRAQSTSDKVVSFAQVRSAVNTHCTGCHANVPSHPAFTAAPLGVVLDNDERILAEAARIHHQTVVTRVMPIGNLTGMTDEERRIIDRWYLDLQDQ
jgi:uncharacterized membrane protein